MKFTKLAKSEKFEYMMLSRLIQDAKYFIEHPDLKHLWARTLDEHIKQMKEQYAKLDPKPEWTSEEEINNLAKQMKESYTNHWNEVHPDNKIEAVIQHPHHNSNHWWLLKDREITRKNGEAFKVAVEDVLNDQRSFDLLDRKIVTREDGELFKKVIDYAIKEGYSYDLLWQKFVTRRDKELFDKVVKQAIKDHWSIELIKDKIITKEELELYKNKDNKIEAAIQQPNKPKPTTMLPDNMQWAWDPEAADWVAVLKDNSNTTPPLYDPNNQNVVNNTTTYMSNIKSASVIDGDEDEDPLSVRLNDLFLSDSSLVDSYIKKEISCDDILNALNIEIKNKREYKKVCNYIKEFIQDNYMGTIKSATLEITDKNGKRAEEGMWLYKPMTHNTFRGDIPLRLFQVKIRHQKDGIDKPYLLSENKLVTKGTNHVKDGILFDTYEEAKQYSESHKTKEEKEFDKLDDWQKVDYYLSKQSSCLAKFLDGPQYSKEIKIEAGLIKNDLVKYAGFDFNRGTKYTITTKGLEVLRKASEAEHNEALNEREKLAYLFGFNTDEVSTLDTTGKVIKSEEITDEQLEESWNKYYPLYRKDIEEEKITEENYPADDEVAQKLKTTLSMYLYGLKRYRKAIPIMKYHTNAKMKRAVEDGHSKGLSEDEITKQVDAIAEEYYKKENKIKPTFNSLSEDYLKSFLFGIIKNNKTASLNKFAKQWNICEADGSELGKVTASSELDAKVKFSIEHPEYADSQSICAKEIKAVNKPFESTMGFYTYEVLWQDNDDKEGEFIEPIQFKLCRDADIDEWSWQCEELFGKQYFYGFLRRQDAMDDVMKKLNTWGKIKGDIKQVDSLYTGKLKQLHSKYEETTETHEPYPNPSETPNDHIVLENHDGWVNTASFEDDVRKQFQQPHQKLPNSDRDLELLEKEILDLIEGDKKEQVKSLFDQFQFSDKEAAQVTPEFAKLHSILGEYKKNEHILSITQDGKDLLVSCSPIASYEMKQKIEQLGYECEETDESETGDVYDLPSYTLRIKMK